MKYFIIPFLLFGLCSCKKDKAVTEPPVNNPPDVSIHNDLIAGSGATSFQRIIGGQKLDVLYSVKQTSDGGYILCGLTENEGASERDVFLIRTNPNGETVWSKKFSDSYSDTGWFVEITSDNGYILAATSNLAATSTNFTPSYCGQLIKTDSGGNQIWKKSFTFGNYTNFTTVKQTGDGGYVVCGTEFGTTKGFLLKTDAAGNESWRKVFGGLIELNDLSKTNDGGFILCGIVKASSSSKSDEYIIKTNSTGDTLWTKTFGDSKDNVANSVKETANGNYILCGYSANPGISGFVRLLNSTGGQVWYNDFSSSNIEELDDVATTNDNHFVAVGRNSLTANKVFLQKIDSVGNSVWVKWFNPSSNNLFGEVRQTADNGFIISGYSNGDGYIVKTDASGN